MTRGDDPHPSKKRSHQPPSPTIRFNPEWKAKFQWIIYNEHQGGILCSVCTKYGKPPIQARGAWVTRAIKITGQR